MSRILRRPMFRGGRVDSRGTGITSGLSYKKGGRVGYQPGGPVLSYADQLALANYQKNKAANKKFTYESVIDRMNDYYNKLYTGGIHDLDLEYGMQIVPRMSAEDIAQANLYEQTPELFEEEFFKGTFDGTDYNKKMAELATAAKIAGEENLYVKPENQETPKDEESRAEYEERIKREAAEELQALLNAETEKDPAEIIKKNKKIFEEAYGSGRGEDASRMLMSFAGKALKPGADTKSAFGEFFEEESKAPSESKKYKDAATTAAINAYLTGEKSIADFEKALKLNRAKISDQISMTRGIKDWQDYLKEGTGTGDKKTSMGSMIYAVEKMNEAGKIDAAWGGPLPDDPSQYQEGLIYVQENPNGGKLLVEWDGEKLFTHTPVYK